TWDWKVEGPYQEQEDVGFGISVAAGDVNGDGFDDVIIGQCFYDGTLIGFSNKEEAVYVYYGSLAGPSTTPGGPNEPSYKPDWSAWSNQGVVSGSGSCAIFGFSVACAGDVNGDGYDDLIIGSNHYQIEGKNRGAAFLYYGSMNGLTKQHTGGQDDPYPDPDWVGAVDVGRPGQVDPEVGACVAGVGDLNNDGFDDVIIGAHWYDYGEVDEGCAFVFYGSSAGLPAAPNWVIGANKTEACLGLCLASAGDVNGDGYSDILVGVYRKESAFVWYGGQVVPARPYFETEGTRIVWGTQPVALYKETGDKWGSRFGYRFKVDKLRQPHVVVVTYPDDEKRTMEIDLFSTAQTALFPDTQTGVFTGEVYPCTNNFKEHKMIFWPQGEDCLITIVNRLNGSRAAARKIEVYEIEGSEATGWLPETHVNLPQDGGRLLGLWWEDPSFFECFGSQNCRNYTEFYRAVRNAMEYLHYTGQNLIIYPIYFYTMPHYPSRVEDCLSSRRTVFQHPREDWFELLLKVAKVNDVFVIPSLTINEIPSLMKMYVDNPVNRRGEPTKKAILNIVDDILGEYGHYPAFKGISFNFWDTALLWRCYGMENTDRGGIHEANHLLNEITQKIQSWRDDLKLVVSCWLPYPHLDDNFDTFWDLDRWCACAGPKEDEIYSLYEEAGLNLAQLKLQDQGIEIERVLSFSAFRQTDSAGQEIPGTSCIRDFFLHE
ncbi:MAG: hypothetical protein QMD82_08550, partial [bacterium]|nr:hypothetical protein [bacterium]